MVRIRYFLLAGVLLAAAGYLLKGPSSRPEDTLESDGSPAASTARDSVEEKARQTDSSRAAAKPVFELGPITTQDLPASGPEKRFALHIPVLARTPSKVNPKDLVIQVLFYDVAGQDVSQTNATVSSRWETSPADWTEGDTETLAVEYRLPTQISAKGERPAYFGYLVRVYYRQQFEASAADPARLAQQYPPPATFPNGTGRAEGEIPPKSSVAQSDGGSTSRGGYQSSSDFAKYAQKLRESAMARMEPVVSVPTGSRALGVSAKYPWKTGIVTTLFSVGSPASEGKPERKTSAWDSEWLTHFGGYDNPDPAARLNYIATNFIPRQNPFYVALPYDDVTGGTTKPEAKVVIPWFREAFTEEGQSVCRNRWIAVRNSSGKICYAQWADCGPFATDHWQYVFGNEKPRPNADNGAGLETSPAVRDFLGLTETDVTDWKFVDFRNVPKGPWALHGDNNPFVTSVRASWENSKSETIPKN